MNEQIKTELTKIVEDTLKLTTQRIGTGLLKFTIKGNEIHQSFDQLEYYRKNNCLEQYLLEL